MTKNLFNLYNNDDAEERCGLILFGGIVVECDNIHPNPTKAFEIDPEQIIRYLNEIEGTWHTHPKADSVFSGEDMLCFTQWPELNHYVLGEDGTRLYKMKEGVLLNAGYFPRPTG